MSRKESMERQPIISKEEAELRLCECISNDYFRNDLEKVYDGISDAIKTILYYVQED